MVSLGLPSARIAYSGTSPALIDEARDASTMRAPIENNAVNPFRPSTLTNTLEVPSNILNNSHGNVAICADSGDGNRSTGPCGGKGGGRVNVDGDVPITRVFGGPRATPIPGLKVINNKLTGNVYVSFSSSSDGVQSQAVKQNMIRKLNMINQTASNGYGIKLNFTEDYQRRARGASIRVDYGDTCIFTYLLTSC
jgi:hypothetical protein